MAPQSADAAASQGSPLKDKPRLTEQEKKNNHIASEQKRRQAIREGFDRLASLVPGYDGQGRSENLVLNAALDYMETHLTAYHDMIDEAKKRGLDVSDLEIPGVPPRDQIKVNKGEQ
jgi:heteromeric Ino2p/Ino4p transcription factor